MKTGRPFMSASSIIGNLVFLSGLNGLDFNTGRFPSVKFEDQLLKCLDNIRANLEKAGSSIGNLVKLVILVKDTKDCPGMWETMVKYYRQHAAGLLKYPPAVAVIPVKSFLERDCLVAIDVTATMAKQTKGWMVTKVPARYPSISRSYPGMDPKIPLFSESATVGNLIFLSAIDGENPDTGKVETGDLETQMDIGFEKIKGVFNRAGSSVSNIIKTLHLLTGGDSILSPSREINVSHSPASDRLWKRELEHYEMYAPSLLEDFPGSTFLKLPFLENPDSLVAIDIIGVRSPDEPGWKVKKYPLYYGKRGFPRHIGEIKKYYANTVVVGDIILISGQTPTDHYSGRIETTTFEDQMQVTLENMKTAIEETGSSLNNLAKTLILLPDLKNYAAMRRLEQEYYQKHAPGLIDQPPASTVICPLNLASPKMHIEIDAVGFL
jgi:enamine deaminase RidA (YjgF/YER057c/UK114 family)